HRTQAPQQEARPLDPSVAFLPSPAPRRHGGLRSPRRRRRRGGIVGTAGRRQSRARRRCGRSVVWAPRPGGMVVARDVLPGHLALWGSRSPPGGHRIYATKNPERPGVTRPRLCGRSTPPGERVLHPFEIIPTHTLQELGTSLEQPLLRTARLASAI